MRRAVDLYCGSGELLAVLFVKDHGGRAYGDIYSKKRNCRGKAKAAFFLSFHKYEQGEEKVHANYEKRDEIGAEDRRRFEH